MWFSLMTKTNQAISQNFEKNTLIRTLKINLQENTQIE